MNKLVLSHEPFVSPIEQKLIDLVICHINEYHSDFIEDELEIQQKEIPCEIVTIRGVNRVLKLDIQGEYVFMDIEGIMNMIWGVLTSNMEEQVLKTLHSPVLHRRAMDAIEYWKERKNS